MKKNILISIFVLSLCYGLFSQNNKTIDSLLTELAIAKQDTNKVKTLLKLGEQYERIYPDTALSYYNKALKVLKEIKNKEFTSRCFIYIGTVYLDQGTYDKANSFYLKSLKIAEELDNKDIISKCYTNIGSVYLYQASYDKAVEYYNKSLKIKEESGDKNEISTCYNNIGIVYYKQGSFDMATTYFNKSLKVFEELNDKEGMSAAYANIGFILKKKGDLNSAIENFLKALKIKEELGDKYGISAGYGNISNISIDMADVEDISKEQKLEYLNRAVEYGTKSYNIAKEIGSMRLEYTSSDYLMVAYSLIEEYEKAMDFVWINLAAKDSLINEEQTRELADMEAKYEYEKRKAIDDANNQKLLAVEKEQKEKQKIISFAIAGGLVLLGVFLIFVINRLKITRKQKDLIEDQKKQVDDAYEELEEKNTEILDSITYAKRIQSAILPPSKIVKEYLKDSFILYKPKDIVAGDFYWMEHKDGKILFAAADCTGHGVPGAMVSVVCNNGLNRSVREHGLTEPGKILDKTKEIVIQEFEKSEEDVKDGMDIALCSLEFPMDSDGNVKLQYAGANNPLWIVRNNEILETKANKQPIGKFDNPEPYTTHSFELQRGDSLYIFSDGYIDQFGGENGKKFKAKVFRELLLSIQNEPMEEQRLLIDESFENWRGKLEQVDDICVIGVRI